MTAVAAATAAAALAAALAALLLLLGRGGGFFCASFFFGDGSGAAALVAEFFGWHGLAGPVETTDAGGDIGVGSAGLRWIMPVTGGGGNEFGVAVASVAGFGLRTRGVGDLWQGFAGADACVPVAGLLANSTGGW